MAYHENNSSFRDSGYGRSSGSGCDNHSGGSSGLSSDRGDSGSSSSPVHPRKCPKRQEFGQKLDKHVDQENSEPPPPRLHHRHLVWFIFSNQPFLRPG